MSRRLVAALIGLCLYATSAIAGVKEETVEFAVDGETVVGTLAVPDGGPAPVVLLFHGFTGTRNELPVTNTKDGVFSRTARMLAESGYASLRIDFRGSGESAGKWEDTTFERQISDAEAAMKFAQADSRVNGAKFAIIGWSQGGLVAAAAAGRTNTPNAVVLWNAAADPVAAFEGLLGKDIVEAGRKAGDEPIKVKLPWGVEIQLKKPFFDGIFAIDPPKEFAAYKGPVLVTQGSADTTVGPDSGDKFLAARNGDGELWTGKMDHVFNAFTGPETLDEMIGVTTKFLDAHLK